MIRLTAIVAAVLLLTSCQAVPLPAPVPCNCPQAVQPIAPAPPEAVQPPPPAPTEPAPVNNVPPARG